MSEISSEDNTPGWMDSSFSHVDLSHPEDHHVTCLHTHSEIGIPVTVAAPLSPDMVGYLHIDKRHSCMTFVKTLKR